MPIEENRDPESVVPDRPGTVILQDDASPGRESWLLYAAPLETVEAHSVGEVPDLLARIEAAAQEGHQAAGFVCYEAAPAFDRAFVTPPASDLPLAWFGIYETCTRLTDLPPAPGATPAPPEPVPGEPTPATWIPNESDATHRAAVDRIREFIAAGDVYQVNHTHRLRASYPGSPWELFRRLARAQEGSHAAFVALPGHFVCSASPELFFRLEGDRIVSRPMKGTAPRGRHAGEDERLAAHLLASEKDRAENLMIVDMVRNDLGRIAEPGSVVVESLYELERYRTVWQLTSTVAAQTRASIPELFRALFPGASVTGAPKIRAMEIIAGLEPEARGIYTGCIGRVGPGRSARFNMAIRTAVVQRGTGHAEYGTGGGITWDSDPARELEECRQKARVLAEPERPAFRLFETIRWSAAGSLFLRGSHLARLADSARYFGFPFDPEAARKALDSLVRPVGAGPWRVRLFLAPDGALATDIVPLARSLRAWRVGISRDPVDERDPFLFHKTTLRARYERAVAASPGADDVLLVSQRGELTESTRANLALRLDGAWLTPALDSGLLPGTLRAALLSRGRLREAVLRRADLGRAERVVLLNSLRGVIRVELISTPETPGPGRVGPALDAG
jgi:para-aminobenzoate synthetase/4-amino-4-deoxychorismate lyase